MQSSTMLIASGFGGDGLIDRGVIPAKLFEYLATDLPILFIGTRGDDGANLLHGQPGCFIVDRSDRNGVDAAIEAALDGARYPRDVDGLSRRARTRDLARVLEAAIANNASQCSLSSQAGPRTP